MQDLNTQPSCRAAGLLLAGLPALLLAGCGKPPAPPAIRPPHVSKPTAPITVQSKNSSFSVRDAQGQNIMDAEMAGMEGEVQSQTGIQGPVKMHKAKCLLYEKGAPSMHLISDEAVWDGKQLITHAP